MKYALLAVINSLRVLLYYFSSSISSYGIGELEKVTTHDDLESLVSALDLLIQINERVKE